MASSHARRKYTFVGIDPGTTIGIAILDLNGKPVEVFSAKNYSISDAITRIISQGNPLIVASDVAPIPAMVKKIGTLVGSLVHELEEPLSLEEKMALTKGEIYEFKNAHERDALAAAINAFKRYKKKFSQVRKKTPAEVNVEEVKALVVQGVSISAAINRLISAKRERQKPEEEEKQEEEKSSADSEKESRHMLRLRGLVKAKAEQIEMLEERTTTLRASLEEKEREIEILKGKLDSLRVERTRELKKTEEIRKRDSEIARLRAEVRARENENAELRGLMKGLKRKKGVKGGQRIKRIRSFSQAAIVDTDRKYGLSKGDIVFFDDGSGGGASTAELLAQKGVVAVIYEKELSHFAADKFSEFNIPFFSNAELPVLFEEDTDDFAFVDPHTLTEKIEEWERERRRTRVILHR